MKHLIFILLVSCNYCDYSIRDVKVTVIVDREIAQDVYGRPDERLIGLEGEIIKVTIGQYIQTCIGDTVVIDRVVCGGNVWGLKR